MCGLILGIVRPKKAWIPDEISQKDLVSPNDSKNLLIKENDRSVCVNCYNVALITDFQLSKRSSE